MTSWSDVTLSCGNPPDFPFLDAAWTFDDGELNFIDVNSDPNATRAFSGYPRRLIAAASDAGATPDSAAGSDAFPDGVYIAGSPEGVVTHSYRDGVWRRFLVDGELDCESTYLVESGADPADVVHRFGARLSQHARSDVPRCGVDAGR